MIILYNRSDRLGSNFISKLCQLIYAHYNKIKIINEHEYFQTELTYVRLWDTKQRSLKSEFNKIFIDYSNNLKNTKLSSTPLCNFFNFDRNKENNHIYLSRLMLDVIFVIKEDIFSYFHKHFKTTFYTSLKQKLSSNIKLPKQKYICYHIRLGDIAKRTKPVNNKIISEYFINKINSDNNDLTDKGVFFKSKYNVKLSKQHEHQSAISDDDVIKNITDVKKKYPNHLIYIVTDSPNLISNKIKQLNYPIIYNKTQDLDLWFLIHSDILITSKSSFSFIAALFHQGSKLFLQSWGLIGSSGLKSKYDKTKNHNINYEII